MKVGSTRLKRARKPEPRSILAEIERTIASYDDGDEIAALDTAILELANVMDQLDGRLRAMEKAWNEVQE